MNMNGCVGCFGVGYGLITVARMEGFVWFVSCALLIYLQFLSLQKAPLLHPQLTCRLPSSHSTIFIGAIMTVFRVESPQASVQLKHGTETGAKERSLSGLTITFSTS